MADKEPILYQATLYYLTAQGERYNGKLLVTPSALVFSAESHLASDGIKDVEGELRMPRSEIATAEAFSHTLIFQRLRVRMKDGTVHVFDRGISSVKPILKALEK